MPIFKKGTKLNAVLGHKCPRCQEGNLFKTPTFSFKQPFDMYDKCPACGLDYFPEPGYYYGAMFISYIGIAWFSIFFVALLHWGIGWSTGASFAALIVVCTLLFVWFFRTARSAWIGVHH